MRMLRMAIAMLALAAGLMGAAPASAQRAYQPRVSFEIAGERYSVAPPAGYCVATGEIEAGFRRLNAAAKSALLFALIPCGPGGDRSDYILVKHSAAMDNLGRKQLLAKLGAEFPGYDVEASNRTISETVGARLDRLIGGKLDTVVDLRPLAVDDVCAYFGGNVSFDGNAGRVIVSAAGCATAIGQRTIYLFRYLPSTDTGRVKFMIDEVRTMAVSLMVE
jgi:hypothetical protein